MVTGAQLARTSGSSPASIRDAGALRARRRQAPSARSAFADAFPAVVQLDRELIALDGDGRPDFHRVADRMLHGRVGIAVTLFVFDVLSVEGFPVTSQP